MSIHKQHSFQDYNTYKLNLIKEHVDTQKAEGKVYPLGKDLSSTIISLYKTCDSYKRSDRLWKAFFFVAAFISPNKASQYALEKTETLLANYLMMHDERDVNEKVDLVEKSLKKSTEHVLKSLQKIIAELDSKPIQDSSLKPRYEELKGQADKFFKEIKLLDKAQVEKMVRGYEDYQEKFGEINSKLNDLYLGFINLRQMDDDILKINKDIHKNQEIISQTKSEIIELVDRKIDTIDLLRTRESRLSAILDLKSDAAYKSGQITSLREKTAEKGMQFGDKMKELEKLEQSFANYDTLFKAIGKKPDRTERTKVESKIKALENEINSTKRNVEELESSMLNDISNDDLTKEMDSVIKDIDKFDTELKSFDTEIAKKSKGIETLEQSILISKKQLQDDLERYLT